MADVFTGQQTKLKTQITCLQVIQVHTRAADVLRDLNARRKLGVSRKIRSKVRG